MRKNTKRFDYKLALLGVAGFVLVGVSFSFASDQLPGGLSLLAAAESAITSKPLVFIGRDGGSPSGVVQPNRYQSLAVFDVSTRNVTHWATLHHLSLQATITTSQPSVISLQNVGINYTYCIPVGRSYGYGFVSKGCASTWILPTSLNKTATGYVASFDKDIMVYPQQSYGAVSIVATPQYVYTGTVKKAPSNNAKIQVAITGATAVGDQCNFSSYGYGYGYSGCVLSTATVRIQAGKGNVLIVQRPYGYGYLAKK